MKNKLFLACLIFIFCFSIIGASFSADTPEKLNYSNDSSDFVVLADVDPNVF
ncbi:hypothetical protein [Methanobrevibacter sp.]|uniref:hypothetical protein n=1 Tax=Methanobrevibacter sp. TaxID=66852 RepID=UPI00388F50A8